MNRLTWAFVPPLFLAACSLFDGRPPTYLDDCETDADCKADLKCEMVPDAYALAQGDTGATEEGELLCTMECETDADCPLTPHCKGDEGECYEGLCAAQLCD